MTLSVILNCLTNSSNSKDRYCYYQEEDKKKIIKYLYLGTYNQEISLCIRYILQTICCFCFLSVGSYSNTFNNNVQIICLWADRIVLVLIIGQNVIYAFSTGLYIKSLILFPNVYIYSVSVFESTIVCKRSIFSGPVSGKGELH